MLHGFIDTQMIVVSALRDLDLDVEPALPGLYVAHDRTVTVVETTEIELHNVDRVQRLATDVVVTLNTFSPDPDEALHMSQHVTEELLKITSSQGYRFGFPQVVSSPRLLEGSTSPHGTAQATSSVQLKIF